MSASLIPISATFSFAILLWLLVILAISGLVFYTLTLQWTAHRPLQSLREWAGDRKFNLKLPPQAQLPPALSSVQLLEPRVDVILNRGSSTLVRFTTTGTLTSARPEWHLLIREWKLANNPAGLRPAQVQQSFLDLFSLNGFPSLLPPERFVAFGAEVKHARTIAASPARGLLPADVGLLMHGPYVTLDFSSRPFDAIEFDRMLAIMDQVIGQSIVI